MTTSAVNTGTFDAQDVMRIIRALHKDPETRDLVPWFVIPLARNDAAFATLSDADIALISPEG